ncbi:MAG: immunoglobulin domain-containing protein [Verrucomicrobiota bacterium]
MAIGDLDGDGKADLVVGSHVGQAVLVYRNIGTPGSLDTNSFASAVSFALGGRVHRGGIAIGDLDGDGKPDVAAATEQNSLLSLYRNVSVPGSFTTNSFCNSYSDTISIYRNIVPFGAVPPSITTQPTNQTVVAGQTATFTVGASGTPLLSYQWKFNGTNLLQATNSTLTLTNVQFNQGGNYTVLVTNLYGSILSSNALLTVLAPPFITVQPTNQTVVVGGTASFSVTASGTPPTRCW